MRLTSFSDYSLRVLIYAATVQDRLITIAELRDLYDLSEGHLMKVVRLLSGEGYLEAVRGRGGGLRLGMAPRDINIGALIRRTEPDFKLVECFGANNACIVAEHCHLPGPLNRALVAFFQTLDEYTLEDMLLAPEQFQAPKDSVFPQRGPAIPAVSSVR